MAALCDVNFLLALVTDRHVHHGIAVHRFGQILKREAIVCRPAQVGLLRLLNNPAVMREDVLETTACWELWHALLGDERINFTAAEPAGIESAFEKMTTGRAFTPRLWSDAYLAAYAFTGGLTVVTFDNGFRQFSGLNCDVLEASGQSP